MPAVVRRSLASGAAIASADGLAVGVTDDEKVVADVLVEDIADDTVDGIGVADTIALFVEFEGSKVESGKNSDTTGIMFEGSMLKDCVLIFSDF